MPVTQAYRGLAINTPLGPDKVVLRRALITEQLGRPFQMELELLSEDPNIAFDKIVGGNATIRLDLPNSKTPRFFNGFISRFVQIGADLKNGQYRATLVPWIWFLTRTANCRIFQNQAVPDILKAIFRAHGFADFKLSLTGTYTPWENCVQYRETDFNFVSRLMEHEGIYYYFEHTDGKHTLVLADAASAHQPFPGYENIPLRTDSTNMYDQEFISAWSVSQEVQPGTYAVNDFNFENPKTSLAANSNILTGHALNGFEIYDYPGEYGEHGEGVDYSKIRIEELHAQQESAHGVGNARGIASGYTFAATDAPRRDQNRRYLVVTASHQLSGDDYQAGGGSGGEGDSYSCSFTAVDATKAFRASRVTPKPVIQGPQTAIIVGPKGEEIHTDKYGRVKVQFHWDRGGGGDENASCWMRISQAAWAGKKWGALSIPRVGQEVIVEFLEGDPDLPIVTGQVYNADTMPPYDLPVHKTRTTIKTNTVGGNGFNELRFEDKKGAEQIFIHAERNQDVRVKSNSLEYVGHDRHLVVEHDQFEAVTGDKHQEVKGEHNQKVGESLSINVEQNIQEKAGMNLGVEAGMEIHVKAGMNLVLEAGASITLKAGGSFVTIGPSGVAISGAMVLVNSGGAPGSGSGSSPTPPKAAQAADTADGGDKTQATSRAPARIKPASTSPTTVTLRQAAADGTPFVDANTAAKVKAITSGSIADRINAMGSIPASSPSGESLYAPHPLDNEEEGEDFEPSHDPEEEARREAMLEQAREIEKTRQEEIQRSQEIDKEIEKDI